MKIQKDQFDKWVASVQTGPEPLTATRIAKLAGISKSSLFFQRGQDYVESSIIIALSRKLNLHPLEELTKFPELKIFKAYSQPSEQEILSQLAPAFLMEELLGRMRYEQVRHYPNTMPEPYGLKRWLDTTDLYGKYSDLAKGMGLSSVQVLSKKINENRLSIGQLAFLCEYGTLNARFGLVVTGMLTWEEAGFDWNIREKTLSNSSGKTVIDALMSARKWLEKDIQVKEFEVGVYRNLG